MFKPPFWLRNPHLQSILPSVLLHPRVTSRAAPLLRASQQHILDCGDDVRLMGWHAQAGPAPSEHLVVLLHGWEGSSESTYVLGLGQALFGQGFDVFRLNLRDHGATHHLNRDLFHSCRLSEVVGAVKRLQALFPTQKLSLAGFSLGGNFALRTGARAGEAGLRLHRIVAISPVLDPQATMDALERGSIVYRRYFVWKWTRSLLKKQDAWPGHYDFRELLRKPTLTHMTDRLVRQHTDFPDLQSYLRGYAIVGEVLKPLKVPSRIIAAADDPIVLERDLAHLPDLPVLRITRTRFGGHCGFIGMPGPDSWIAQEVLRDLHADPAEIIGGRG
jgi:hypothetical protein